MPKNIVLCCDGTSNTVYKDSTNVLRLYRSLVRSDQQLTYYDPGVGVLSDPTRKTKFGKWFSRSIDMGIGASVRENVCEAYRFLARNYEAGDQVYLFGFSRGAYTVRALAGMVKLMGLTRPELSHLATDAWAIYADDEVRLTSRELFEAAGRFKKCFSTVEEARIHFVGVWDTVSAFGFIWDLRSVPHTAKNPVVNHVRHAVAIDERRALFGANLYSPGGGAKSSFKEVWFAGTHGDVGGGWPKSKSGLAKIPLEWMYQEASDAGLLLEQASMDEFLGRSANHKDEPPPDPMAEINNSMTSMWWPLELLPRRKWRKGKMRWQLPNFGRRRPIPKGAKLHPSVQTKIDRDDGYNPSNIKLLG